MVSALLEKPLKPKNQQNQRTVVFFLSRRTLRTDRGLCFPHCSVHVGPEGGPRPNVVVLLLNAIPRNGPAPQGSRAMGHGEKTATIKSSSTGAGPVETRNNCGHPINPPGAALSGSWPDAACRLGQASALLFTSRLTVPPTHTRHRDHRQASLIPNCPDPVGNEQRLNTIIRDRSHPPVPGGSCEAPGSFSPTRHGTS